MSEDIRRLVEEEKKAEKIIEEARERARLIIEEAKKTAEKILRDAKNVSFEDVIREGEARIEALKKEILEEYRNRAQHTRNIAEKNFDRAVDFAFRWILGLEEERL